MAITSLTFAAFTAVVLVLYYLLPRRPQNILLLGASYAFLVSWQTEFALSFAVLTAANFYLAKRVKGSKRALWAGIAVNVLALAFFKYHHFFIPPESLSLKILLPIGLSFYIVQAISYLMDIDKGLLEPEEDALDFALYMAYFPRLTSGPIERARDFLPKLKAQRSVDNDAVSRSFTLLLIGLFRKIAVADVLNIIIPSDIFNDPQHYAAPALAIWLLAYAFALYNDFAGYTSIVRGISGLFGIELSNNFSTPYLARNFVEFWQRWHISLSEWLRDYIFTPSTRALLRRKYNSRHALTVIVPPLLTMFISALWHDVSWNMLLWGGLHGVFQVLERFRAIWRPSPPPQNHPAWRQVSAMLLVFLLASLLWVPFHTSVNNSLDYWQGLVNTDSWLHPADNFNWGYHLHVVVLVLVGMVLVLDVLQYRLGELAFMRWHPLSQAILINIAIFAIILGTAAQGDAPPPFIYQGF